MLKLNIRGKTISYSVNKAKIIKAKEEELGKNIQKLEDLLVKSQKLNIETISLSHIESDLQLLKENLIKLREPKLKAMVLRSKIQYYEQGERSYKFFSNLERKNSSSKVISRLNVKGQIIENQNQILGEMRKFYKDLYSSRNCNVDTSPFFSNDQNIKQLKEQNKILCEKPIVESEAKLVIKNMKNGKTPSSDGYPVEFYKIFWNDIGDFLLRSFNEGFSKGELSVTQRHGILTCTSIPKGQKS